MSVAQVLRGLESADATKFLESTIGKASNKEVKHMPLLLLVI